MPLPVIVLYIAYAVNFTVLLGGIFYVTLLKAREFVYLPSHPYLHGARLTLAFLLPFLWLHYTYSDCIHAMAYLNVYEGTIDIDSLWSKAWREVEDCFGAILQTIFLVDRVTYKTK